jgi:chromosome segregation ATPase
MTTPDGEVQPLPAGVADREAGGIPTGERDRHRDQVQAPQGRATEVGPPTAELGTARDEADHLRANLREVREPLAALQAAGSLAGEIEALRADRDRLEGEVQGLRAELTAHRSEQEPLERSLAEAEGRHEAAQGALARELEVARGRGEAGRQALQERIDLFGEAERRWDEERARAEGERRSWQERCEEARRQIDRDRASHRDERERLAAAHDELQAALREAEHRHQTEVAQLNLALTEARGRAEARARRAEELGGQVEGLRVEAHRQHQDREAERRGYEEALSALRQEPGAARADLQHSSDAAGDGREAMPTPPASPPASGPSPPDPHAGLYSDIILGQYDSDAFKRLVRKRRR